MIDVPGMLEAKPRGDGQWMARCPAHEDGTPSLSIRMADGRWLLKCFGGCATDDVRGALGLSWADLMGEHASEQRGRHPGPHAQRRWGPRPSIQAKPASDRVYPDADEVRALWEGCEAITMPPGEPLVCAEWLKVERGICPAAVTGRDLARVLTKDTPLPSWARFRSGRTWYASGHRLVIPLHDHEGRIRSFKARSVLGRNPKEAAPTDRASSGLVFADMSGRYLLEHGKGRYGNRGPDGRLEVVIAEGVPDFLTWSATRKASDLHYPAVLAVSSGAWTKQIAARIPDGTRVVVATDYDKAGDDYANIIAMSLAGRCELRRHGKRAAA